MNYSVLMSVYQQEKAENLKHAMNSMWNQTVPTNDFVLMCDGALTAELDAVIAEMQALHSELRVIRLRENGGLGCALRTGVVECRNELIARMDSDDISRPDRCEKELSVIASRPELSLVGSWVGEFTGICEGTSFPAEIESTRVVPEKPEDIRAFAKKRNPFNHPAVMFRKTDVLKAGNYGDTRYLQDYFLWVAMLLEGCKGYNIQESLVYMRVDNGFFERRGGNTYRDIQISLFRYMREQGFISGGRYFASCVMRVGCTMAPGWLRKFIYRKVLRKA